MTLLSFSVSCSQAGPICSQGSTASQARLTGSFSACLSLPWLQQLRCRVFPDHPSFLHRTMGEEGPHLHAGSDFPLLLLKAGFEGSLSLLPPLILPFIYVACQTRGYMEDAAASLCYNCSSAQTSSCLAAILASDAF